MNSRMTSLAVLVSMVVLALMAGCGQGPGATEGRESTRGQPEGDGKESLMVNRIAYVNNSGDLLLINPDGTGEERLTGDVRAGLLAQTLQRGDSYSWPTWSPDGSRLVASRVSITGEGAGLSLQVFDVSTGRRTPAYENDVPAPVADGAAHYIYWSPQGRYLSFLAPTREGLALFVRDFEGTDEAAPLVVGAPLYYHWSQDDNTLAVHSGDRLLLTEPRRDGGQAHIDAEAVGFRVPALSPDGTQLAYAAIEGEVQGVFVRTVGPPPFADMGTPRLITETRGLVVFAWSPDGSGLAVSEQASLGSPLLNRLSVHPVNGSEATMLVDESHLAFFWSPSGDRIAWIGVDAATREMELAVSAVAGGDPRRLYRFSPTGEFFTYLSFFDQYAYSHSLWAPDGSALVVAGTEGQQDGRRNGSGPSGGHIYVVDADTGTTLRIASGKTAVWSWN